MGPLVQDRRDPSGRVESQTAVPIKYVPALEDGAFGFLDPDDIIRGSHLIGGFNLGHRTHPPGDPRSVWDPEKESDWETYYVNQ